MQTTNGQPQSVLIYRCLFYPLRSLNYKHLSWNYSPLYSSSGHRCQYIRLVHLLNGCFFLLDPPFSITQIKRLMRKKFFKTPSYGNWLFVENSKINTKNFSHTVSIDNRPSLYTVRIQSLINTFILLQIMCETILGRWIDTLRSVYQACFFLSCCHAILVAPLKITYEIKGRYGSCNALWPFLNQSHRIQFVAHTQ